MNASTFPVTIQLEHWASDTVMEVISTIDISIEQIIAELYNNERTQLAEEAAAGRTDLDWIYERAVDLGLTPAHGGPYTVDVEPLAEWLDENPGAMMALPYRARRVVTVGRPLVNPVSAQQAVSDADETGNLTAMVQVPFDDLMAAHASRDDEWDEHDLLASKVSPLLAYGSSYDVVGLVPVEGSQPDLLVLFTNNVVEAASYYNEAISLFEDGAPITIE